jgi:hypothetical protein
MATTGCVAGACTTREKTARHAKKAAGIFLRTSCRLQNALNEKITYHPIVCSMSQGQSSRLMRFFNKFQQQIRSGNRLDQQWGKILMPEASTAKFARTASWPRPDVPVKIAASRTFPSRPA